MENKKHIERYIVAALIVCALLVLALSGLLIEQYRHVRNAEHLPSHHSLLSALHSKGPVGPTDATLIESWMTFDYINHVFALPPEYLKTSLAVTDPRYPRMTITEAAQDAHESALDMLAKTQASVRAFTPNNAHP